MARQPAIKLGIACLMALYAKSHLVCNGVNAIHPVNLPVTGCTFDLLFQVGLVIKPAIIGKIHESYPGNGGFSVKVISQFYYLRMPGYDKAVAEKACANRWDTGVC
jgi:hypothetical protein